jgi:hypothetical protein
MLSSLLYSSSDDSDCDSPAPKKVYRERVNFTKFGDFQFKESFRLTSEEVEFVLEKIGHRIKHKTLKNNALTPQQQLRFPCLHHLRVEPEFAGMIILACVTLHNIANKDELTYDPVDAENDYGGTPVTGPETSTDAGKQRVNELLTFFA